MITEEKFMELVKKTLDRNPDNNREQKKAILADLTTDEYIIAGPGSGKTTTLVLKILKYHFVDEIDFKNIMVTTFTKKAARQLKQRTIKWAETIADEAEIELTSTFDDMIIGTLDSIAEDFVTKYDNKISVIDNFTSSAIMMQTLLEGERNNDKKLKQFVKKINDNQAGTSTSEMNNVILTLRCSMYNDMADIDKLHSTADREEILFDIIDDYDRNLGEKNILDYPLLETKFHEIIDEDKFLRNNLKILLVDEYQDTNYLQEQIYFKLAKYAKNNGGSISVVGDDDQSLYRFRGADVSLFTNYPEHIEKQAGIKPEVIRLLANYRSTNSIVDFLNSYLSVDKYYHDNSRSTDKHDLKSYSTAQDLPVVGIFRNNIEQLTNDLSEIIYSLKKSEEVKFESRDESFSVKFNNPSVAVLTNSPKEINAYNKKRLPHYIRNRIVSMDEDMVVFNPRGQSIESTEVASLICGLILLFADRDGSIESTVRNIPPRTVKILKQWRSYATEYADKNNVIFNIDQEKINIQDLLEIIDVECSDLVIYSAENSVYYEIITEAIEQTANAISYDKTLTRKQIFWHILLPVALGAVEIDDDLFDMNLEDNINIMSIHQAKGLEFDVVIVDVGSDINNNKPTSAFKRFPQKGGRTHNIEKYVRQFSNLNVTDDEHAVDMAFDELIRRYFVAYSRARSLLILCGLNSMRFGYKGIFQPSIKIPNIATGWNREKKWTWKNLNNLFNI